MAGETPLSFEGTLGRDPELKFAQSGKAFVRMSVAKGRRIKDANGQWGDDESAMPWFNVTAFGALAESIAESLHKGDRVVVIGRFYMRTYTTDDGQEKIVADVTADSVGAALTFATATIHKSDGGGMQRQQAQPQGDPWGQHAPQGGYSEEPPF